VIELWRSHDKQIDYRKGGVARVIGIIHKALELQEPKSNSVHDTIKNAKNRPPQEARTVSTWNRLIDALNERISREAEATPERRHPFRLL
jgi:hypothetical protein